MNADAFRHLYDYHFAENRKLWNWFVSRLSPEQFTHHSAYSHGSVRDQIVHLINVDDGWFSELRVVPFPEPFAAASSDDRPSIRAHWDRVEHHMRDYLAALHDEMLFTTPIQEPEEDKHLFVWQVLLHIVNHGTDHRAQILRLINAMGIETAPQDYMFYAYDHPVAASR